MGSLTSDRGLLRYVALWQRELISIFTRKTTKCVNVFVSTLVKLVSRSVTPAGSCTAWSMASNLMDRCHLTSQLVVAMTHSTLSSRKLDPASTFPVPSSSIWNQLSSMRFAPAPTALSSTPRAHYRQGRCCQQLCPWTLHYRQRDRRLGARPHPQAVRPMHRSSRIPHLPLFRRRYRIRIHLPVDGTPFGRLRKEIQIGIRHLPSSPSLDCRRRALQLHPDHPHYPGTL